MIQGTVRSGQGGASKAMQGEKLRERSEVAGVELVPGTLNVQVRDLAAAVESLGEPHAYSDQGNERLGPLQWWPVEVRVRLDGSDHRALGWIVRHERTSTRYLEVVSSVHFRDELGVWDGAAVWLEPR